MLPDVQNGMLMVGDSKGDGEGPTALAGGKGTLIGSLAALSGTRKSVFVP